MMKRFPCVHHLSYYLLIIVLYIKLWLGNAVVCLCPPNFICWNCNPQGGGGTGSLGIPGSYMIFVLMVGLEGLGEVVEKSGFRVTTWDCVCFAKHKGTWLHGGEGLESPLFPVHQALCPGAGVHPPGQRGTLLASPKMSYGSYTKVGEGAVWTCGEPRHKDLLVCHHHFLLTRQ